MADDQGELGIRPASVQVLRQQGDRRVTATCTQCARQLGMIGERRAGRPVCDAPEPHTAAARGQGSLFDALSGSAAGRDACPEASAGNTRTAAIGTDPCSRDRDRRNVATEALQRAARRRRDARPLPGVPKRSGRGDLHVHTERQARLTALLRRGQADGRWAGRERAFVARAARRG